MTAGCQTGNVGNALNSQTTPTRSQCPLELHFQQPAKSTPTEIVGKLTNEINAGLTDSKTRAQLADLGGTPLLGSPADFGKLIAEEIEKWAKVVKVAGLKPD